MEYLTQSEKETRSIGGNLAKQLPGGDILLLYGELGAGKTTLVKGIAEGLGVQEAIVSPTFTLMNVYELKNVEFRVKNFVHVDTYRLESEQQLIDIGIEDYLGDPETVCVIEWPEKLKTLLKEKKTISVYLSHQEDKKGDKRRITLT